MVNGACRGCGAALTTGNDSDAHIIPNALGGRLKPRGIICRACNTHLDKVADNALVKAFGDWPTLIGFPRDNGSHPPKLVPTMEGRSVRLEADGSMRLNHVQYDFAATPDGDGHLVEIGASNMKTARELLKRVNADLRRAYEGKLGPGETAPQIDLQEAEGRARLVDVTGSDMLKLRLDFSPAAVFGGVVSALWLFLIHKTGQSPMDWNRLLTCISDMQAHGGTFRYMTEGLPGLRGPQIDLGHKIVLRSVPATGEAIGYVEILGVLRIGGVFLSVGKDRPLLEHIYAYDVGGQIDRSGEFSVDAAEFDAQNWRTVGLGPTDGKALREHFSLALKTFETLYRQRFQNFPDDAPSEADASPEDAAGHQPV